MPGSDFLWRNRGGLGYLLLALASVDAWPSVSPLPLGHWCLQLHMQEEVILKSLGSDAYMQGK